MPTLSRLLAGVAIVAALLGGGYFKGHYDGRTGCEAKVKAAIEQQKRDDAKAVADMKAKADQLEAAAADADQQVADYERLLASRPDKACTLTPEDAREINR